VTPPVDPVRRGRRRLWLSTRSPPRVDVSRETIRAWPCRGAEVEQRLGLSEAPLARCPLEQRTFCRYTHSSGIPVLGGLDLEEYLVAEPIQVSVPPTTLKPQLT